MAVMGSTGGRFPWGMDGGGLGGIPLGIRWPGGGLPAAGGGRYPNGFLRGSITWKKNQISWKIMEKRIKRLLNELL